MQEVEVNISKLKEVRKGKRLFQEEVAKAIGMSKSQYSLIERGERRVRLDVAKQLAVFFEVTIEDLFFNN